MQVFDISSELAKGVRGEILTNPPNRYTTDFGRIELTGPRAVVVASDATDVQLVVRYAYEKGLKVVVRGHGCSSNGICLGDQIVIDMRALDSLRAVSPDCVAVGAGKRLLVLQEELVAMGLSCMVLGDSPAATIGGFLSVGGFGSSSGIKGPAINHVRALQIVTGMGELVRAEREGEHSGLFRYALGGLGQTGVIVGVELAVRPYRPFWCLQGRTFGESTTVAEVNEALTQAQPWDHCFTTFDIGTRRWRINWATEHESNPEIGGVPVLAKFMGMISYRVTPLMGYPLTAGDALGKPKFFARMLQRSLGSAQQRGKTQRYLENAVDASPRGLVIKHAYRVFQQGAESYVQGIVAGNIRAGRAKCFSDLRCVWNDFLVPSSQAEAVFRELNRIFDDPVATRGYFGTHFYNNEGNFSQLPLCPVPDARRVNSFGPYCLVPESMVAQYRRRFDAAREAVLSAGGRVYLFGYHPRNEAFYRRQFGNVVVDEWKTIKSRYDPGSILGASIF